MNKKSYNQWATAMNEMIRCVVNEDMDKAQIYKAKADKIFEGAVREHEFFKKNINNFGIISPIIESKVADWFNAGQERPMKEYMKLMREDKNLHAQYKFYHAMKNYTSSAPSKEYVKESLREVKRCLNEDTIAASNQKLVNFMKKYHITKNLDLVSEEKKLFCDACQFLLENKANVNTRSDIYDNIEMVANHIEQNPRKVVTEDKKQKELLMNTISQFNKKYSMMEGRSLEIFNILLEKKEESDTEDIKQAKDEKKMKLLNDMKSDCISKIEELKADASADEIEKIEEMRAMVDSMVYEESTIVSNIAKLLEIRDVLSEQ